ncbi:MAG: TVP38/TMEM64 family protein [Sedimentisphaerales bacterium]
MKLGLKSIFWILFAAGIITTIIFLPLEKWLISILEWTKGMGIWGPVIVAGLYAVGAILFLPGSFLTMATGFLFKVVVGTITVSVGSTIGACAAFMIARTFGRKWVVAKIVKSRQFSAFDHAVKLHAFKVILLTRLSPAFPYNMLNYAFGLTKIEFWKYALGSWVGMIPPTIMYTYFGSGLRSLTEIAAGRAEKEPSERMFFWIGLAVTIVTTLFIANLARKALRQEIPDNDENSTLK